MPKPAPSSAQDVDVLVVGAGPAGSATAYYLAREGWHVTLVDRAHFPRSKCCGDGLTWGAVKSLSNIGVLPHLENAQPVGGLRVYMEGRGSRDFQYEDGSYGLVIRRKLLDDVILQAAKKAGAEFHPGTEVRTLLFSGHRVSGITTRSPSGPGELTARVIVAADGANSRLARQAGLGSTHPRSRGFAMRCYIEVPQPINTSCMEFMMPLVDRSSRVLASYGWVFPLSPSVFNLGVGVFSPEKQVNIRRLFEGFLRKQLKTPRFSDACVISKPVGAPLTFGFSPTNIHRPGLIAVGDAAGLVNPFTGEGIATALDSGEIAASCISNALRKSRANGVACTLDEYPTRMRRRFAGLFEAGQRANRRTKLVWHALHDSFNNERPLFELCRKTLLNPEQVTTRYDSLPRSVCEQLVRDFPSLPTRLIGVNERLLVTVRREWPFLARAITQLSLKPGRFPLRPALLVALSAGNYEKDPKVESLGAALELGVLGVGFQQSVTDATPKAVVNRKDQSNLLAVVCSDFLLTQALLLCSEVGSEFCETLQTFLSRIASTYATLRLSEGRPTVAEYLQHIEGTTGLAFAASCVVGSRLGGRPSAECNALKAYGQSLGVVVHLLADLKSCEPRAWTRRARTYPTWPTGLGLPLLSVLNSSRQQVVDEILASLNSESDSSHKRALELVQTHGGFDDCRALLRNFRSKARLVVGGLPPPLSTALNQLVTHYSAKAFPFTHTT